MMRIMTMSKCPHGGNYDTCCRCKYGSLRRKEERAYDLVDELRMPIGYKLHAWTREEDGDVR